MITTTVKKELSTYLPLLSVRQQVLVLDMIKNILHVDAKEKRISVEQYNTEIELALSEKLNKAKALATMKWSTKARNG